MTLYFHWEPDVAWGMTYTKLQWWASQAKRIAKIKANNNG
nr:hypothetical protein [Symbiopectobacterium purcellii]